MAILWLKGMSTTESISWLMELPLLFQIFELIVSGVVKHGKMAFSDIAIPSIAY